MLQRWITDVGIEPNMRRKMDRDYNRNTWTDTADGIIPANGLVKILPADGTTIAGTADSLNIIGVNAEGVVIASGAKFTLTTGLCTMVAATPILAGSRIKAAGLGKVAQLVDSVTIGTVIKTSSAGSAFGNQPANDAVTVVSDSAADATPKSVTIIGTTNGGVVVVSETIVLTGVTPVTSVKTDWGLILAIKKSATTGIITVAEASGGLTITTLTGVSLSKGVDLVAAASQGAFNAIPSVTCSGTGTKTVGIQYLAVDGTTTAYEAVAQNGVTAAPFATAALSIQEVYTGDVEAARTSIIKTVATAETSDRCIGKAYTAAVAAGATFTGILNL